MQCSSFRYHNTKLEYYFKHHETVTLARLAQQSKSKMTFCLLVLTPKKYYPTPNLYFFGVVILHCNGNNNLLTPMVKFDDC